MDTLILVATHSYSSSEPLLLLPLPKTAEGAVEFVRKLQKYLECHPCPELRLLQVGDGATTQLYPESYAKE